LTLYDAFGATVGIRPDGWTLIDQDEAETRDLRVYLFEDQLLFGFGPTKGELLPVLSPDWRENLKIKKVTSPCGRGKVTEGAAEEFLRLLPAVKRNLGNSISRIWLPGFSQGAELSGMYWRWLTSRSASILTGLGFAMPNPWDQEAAEDFGQALAHSGPSTFRRINAWGDPVPLLPPFNPAAGPEVRIGPCRLLPSFRIPTNHYHNADYYLEQLYTMEGNHD